jgi:DNA-binding NtrC family response regulator
MPKPRLSVVIVEDEEVIAEALQEGLHELLPEYLLKFAWFKDGDDAFRYIHFASDMIDLLVTDLVHPGMGGEDLVEHVSKHRPETKIVVVSGHGTSYKEKVKVSPYKIRIIQKPCQLRELAEEVKDLLDR